MIFKVYVKSKLTIFLWEITFSWAHQFISQPKCTKTVKKLNACLKSSHSSITLAKVSLNEQTLTTGNVTQ